MSAGDIVEFEMQSVVKGLYKPTSYEPTSMFSGTILKTKRDNAIIRFTEFQTLTVPLNCLERPRNSPYTSTKDIKVGQKVQVLWLPTNPKKSITGWWDATVTKKNGKKRCTVEYTTKFDTYVESETVDLFQVRPKKGSSGRKKRKKTLKSSSGGKREGSPLPYKKRK